MMLLLSFDLPRITKNERYQATRYHNKLISLGFSMKQFSLYEREIDNIETRDKIIDILSSELPDTGAITVYSLPDEVNNSQITILGKDSTHKITKKPQLIFI